MTNAVSRIAVALVGLPIVLAAGYYGGWALFVLILVGGLVAMHEYVALTRSLRPLALAAYGGFVGAVVGAMLGGGLWLLLGVLAAFPLAFLFAAVSETRQSTTVAVSTTILGAVWLGVGLGSFILLRETSPDVSESRHWVFATLIAVFATDTFAYFGGRLLGTHKMSPAISPGKTWEGWIVGAVAGVVATWIVLYDEPFLEQWQSFVLGGAIVVAATIGDLFESMVKRDMGVKDTGRILAGHGGVLDRVDSLLWAGPAAFVTLLGLNAL
jgi:phosphatidate cytidylyltransferase